MSGTGTLQVTLYSDAAYYPDRREGLGAFHIEVWRGFDAEEEVLSDIIKLGSIADSTLAEYVGCERALIHLKQKVLNGTGSRRVALKLRVDNQVLAQVLKGLKLPLQVQLDRCAARIRRLLADFAQYDVDWIQRADNPAGRLLESPQAKEVLTPAATPKGSLQELLRQAGEYRRRERWREAAEVLRRVRELVADLEADLRTRAGDLAGAARVLEQAGHLQAAGRRWQQAGYPHRAARCAGKQEYQPESVPDRAPPDKSQLPATATPALPEQPATLPATTSNEETAAKHVLRRGTSVIRFLKNLIKVRER
jgi:hypothetical protein